MRPIIWVTLASGKLTCTNSCFKLKISSELNTRLITLRTEMGDLQQSVDYLKTVALEKPHGERSEEILADVEADMASLADDIGRVNRRFQ